MEDYMYIPYSWKIWGELNLVVWQSARATAKLKFTNISCSYIYIWRFHTEPPNLNPPIHLWWQFGTQLPNYFWLYSSYQHLRYVLLCEFCFYGISSHVDIRTLVQGTWKAQQGTDCWQWLSPPHTCKWITIIILLHLHIQYTCSIKKAFTH